MERYKHSLWLDKLYFGEIKLFKNKIRSYFAKIKGTLYSNRLLRWVSIFYTIYVLFPELYRRHKGLLSISSNSRYFQLRREIHRIEKGLSFKVLREFFGEESLNRIHHIVTLDGEKLDENIKSWLFNVLEKYSPHCPSNMKKKHSEVLSIAKSPKHPRHRPYLAKRKTQDISSGLLDLVCTRRSTRFFKPDTLKPNIVEEMIRAAATAPSACNRQPYKIRSLYDEDASRCCAIAAGTQGWSYQVRNLLIVSYHVDAYTDPKDFKAPIIDSSFFVMQFVLIAEANGYGSCVINWGEMKNREREIRKQFLIGEKESVLCLLAFGIPDQSILVPSSVKREL